MLDIEDTPFQFELLGLTFTVYPKLLLRLTVLIWIALLLILFVSQKWFAYEMTNADIPGGLISGFLLAYLITILIR